MVKNSIENNKIKNSEINQTINIFMGYQDLSPEAIKKLKEMYPNEFKNSKEEEIKKEIEKLYKDAMGIVNVEEASLYISQKNIDKLITYYLQVPVLKADEPLEAVANGTGVLLKNIENHQRH